MIPCSSSTTWTGPRRRAGEQRMRTVLQEGGIWWASIVMRRRSSCLSTAKAAASGSAWSTIPQRGVSGTRDLKGRPPWKDTPLVVLNTFLFQSLRLLLERWITSFSHQLGSRGAQQPWGPWELCRNGEQQQWDPLLVEWSQLWCSPGLDMHDHERKGSHPAPRAPISCPRYTAPPTMHLS